MSSSSSSSSSSASGSVPFTPAGLKNEIVTDPMGLGLYAPYLAGQFQTVANLLNQTTGPGAGSVYVNNMPVSAFVQAIQPADFSKITSLMFQQFSFLFTGGTLDGTNPNTRGIFAALVAGAGFSAATGQALAAAGSKTGSRAEVLWGCYTVISSQQVQAV